ncbi:MAG: metallophosphoesterase [Bacteroidaceae bacterium]|nr:metallophosphoesterase [Bacteroidaceae bacterium]
MNLALVLVLLILTASELFILFIDAIVAAMAALLWHKKFITWYKYGLYGLLVPLVFILTGTTCGINGYKINRICIQSPAVPESFDGYRIVQISDMHLQSFRTAGEQDKVSFRISKSVGSRGRFVDMVQGSEPKRTSTLVKFVDAINSLHPDIIAFTGDLVTFLPSELDGFESVLSSLKAKDGVYSVFGNHDYASYSPYFITKADSIENSLYMRQTALGWTVLRNEGINVVRGTDSIGLAGVDNISVNPRFVSKGNLSHAVRNLNRENFNILLSHDPTHWEAQVLPETSIDLMLAGHTHGMQLGIFGFTPSRFIYKQDHGLYRCDKEFEHNGNPRYLYVNTGLGQTLLPMRIGLRPEITLITLKSCPERSE